MILLAVLVAATQAVAPPPAGDDLTVTARRIERLKQLRIVVKKDRRTGGRRCYLKPSSEDAVLDTGVCDIYLACSARAETAPVLEACMRPPLTDLVKRRLGPF